MYHDQDTFDFNQGHMTKNQPMAVPDRVEPMEGGKEGWELMSPLCIFEQRWRARAKHSLSGTIIPISNLTS